MKQNRPRILVVEDEATTRAFISSALSAYQPDLVACDNGRDGLDLYMKSPPFDLIILDILMPEFGGDKFLHVAEVLHKEGVIVCPGKILVYTSVSDEGQLRCYSELEVVANVCRKPVSKRELLERAAEILATGPCKPESGEATKDRGSPETTRT